MDKELPVSAWPEWKIVEKIGEGSFGQVYKAQRTERGKSFYSAIKIINIPGSQSELNSVRSETGNDQAAREYFQNLVEECIQEIGTMEYFRGNSYIVSVEDFKVMEYLDAIGWEISIRMEYLTSFLDYCAEKQLQEKEVIQMGLDLSKALGYCRKLHIIHRDVKPENIFVSRFGDFKLGDFGIARELERTMSGFSKKGTYSYMAPEMYKGEKYDSRVDIYSLGIVLYKLMNHNRLPFMNLEKQFITYRDKENALNKRMSGEQMDPPAEAGKLFGQIILKACAFDPDERYQTPEEFYRALDDLKNGRIRNLQSVGTVNVATAEDRQAAQKAVVQKMAVKETDRDAELQSSIQSARATAARRRRRKREQRFRRGLVVTAVLLAVLILAGVYIKFNRDSTGDNSGNSGVSVLDTDKNSSSDNNSKSFNTALATIKDQATTITDNLNSYDWVGSEGTVLRYLRRISTTQNDDGDVEIESECMKALVYPAQSAEGKYEEYFYWGEKLFFAYIWYDETSEYYYYDDGKLIRWIDSDGKAHDNETDNEEYTARGEKYWKNSLKALKGEGTKTDDDVSD
ncbi:serine/threonine protein kinase [Blautia sp. HCP3S3_C4]|uniref:serine/threonine protein kinase n=1 Tax=Blautia sp. HCP3S3_C4 TaxID=3438911 RepID=UPI003F8C9D65|nr:serine/threonine-protein kinase [Ruminococcus sp.]